MGPYLGTVIFVVGAVMALVGLYAPDTSVRKRCALAPGKYRISLLAVKSQSLLDTAVVNVRSQPFSEIQERPLIQRTTGSGSIAVIRERPLTTSSCRSVAAETSRKRPSARPRRNSGGWDYVVRLSYVWLRTRSGMDLGRVSSKSRNAVTASQGRNRILTPWQRQCFGATRLTESTRGSHSVTSTRN